MTTAFFSSYQEYNYLLNIRTDHLFNILNNTLLLPLCKSSRNFSVSQRFWQAFSEYHSILKKFPCFGKYVQSYLLQPLSAQEDLWGLSLQLQIKPQKIIIYLISLNKESRKEGIINGKKKPYVFIFPFPNKESADSKRNLMFFNRSRFFMIFK